MNERSFFRSRDSSYPRRRSISNPGSVVSSSSNIASFRVLSKSCARYNSSGTSSRAVDGTLEKKLEIWELMVVLVGRGR